MNLIARFSAALMLSVSLIWGVCEGGTSNVNSQFGGLHCSLDVLLGAGMKWFRYDMEWQAVEKNKGEFNFGEMDSVTSKMASSGINILGILEYPPCWAAEAPEGYTGYCGNFPPERLEDWENYVYNMVSHFKDRVRYWEIWNEPNIGFLKAPPERYSELLKSAYIAAKKADPNCKIVGCSTSGIDVAFIKRIYQCGGKNYFDILSIHPYRNLTGFEPNFIRDINELRKLMISYGDYEKPVWSDEWRTKGDDLEKAGNLVKMYVLNFAYGVDKIFQFQAYKLYPGPAYVAHRMMVNLLKGAACAGKLDLGEDVYAFMFYREDPVMVIWSSRGDRWVSFDTGSEAVEIVKVTGEVTRMLTFKGNVHLLATSIPVLITGISPAMVSEILENEILLYANSLVERVGSDSSSSGHGLALSARDILGLSGSPAENSFSLLDKVHSLREKIIDLEGQGELPPDTSNELLGLTGRIIDTVTRLAEWKAKTEGERPAERGKIRKLVRSAEGKIRKVEREIEGRSGNRLSVLERTEMLKGKSESYLASAVDSFGRENYYMSLIYSLNSERYADQAELMASFETGQLLDLWILLQAESDFPDSLVRIDAPADLHPRDSWPQIVPKGSSFGLKIKIDNRSPEPLKGDVELAIPDGWGCEKRKFAFEIGGRSGKTYARDIHVPEGIPGGVYEIKALYRSNGFLNEASVEVEVGVKKFITSWNLLGTFPNHNCEGFWREFPPERGAHPDSIYYFEGREYRWRKYEAPDGLIDLQSVFGDRDSVVAYGLSYVRSPDRRKVDLQAGSDDGIRIWLNGRMVLDRHEHGAVELRKYSSTAELHPGWNELLVKIEEGKGDWAFCISISDAEGLHISARP